MIVTLVNAITRLADALVQENTALEALDMAGAVAVLPDKRRALEVLTTLPVLDLPHGQRPAAEAALRRLRTLAEENRQLLQRALTVQSRVIEVIAGALPRPEPAGRYAASGSRPQPARPQPARPTAWSLVARA